MENKQNTTTAQIYVKKTLRLICVLVNSVFDSDENLLVGTTSIFNYLYKSVYINQEFKVGCFCSKC